MDAKQNLLKRKNRFSKIKKTLFFVCLIILPLTQFALMYVGVNINSIIMSFRKFDPLANEWSWNGLNNFKQVFNDLKYLPELTHGIWNSIIAFLIPFVIGVSLNLLFSYYIYKRRFGYKFFRIMLFMPSIVMAVIMATILKYYADRFVPDILNTIFNTNLTGFLSNKETIFPTLLIFSCYCGFGVPTLMYVGAMDAISPGVMEAATLDGAGEMRTFFSIVLPQIIPTISVFVTTSVAAIFTNQLSLYSFYGSSLPYQDISVIGYYMYRGVALATSYAEYPTLAALGLLCTAVTAPAVLLIRRFMERINPMND